MNSEIIQLFPNSTDSGAFLGSQQIKPIEVVTFGPLCVDHKMKNSGIGKILLDETIPLVKAARYPAIVIFGEPYYYPKRGFKQGRDYGLTDLNGNAWDSFLAMELTPGALNLPGEKFRESDVYEDLPEDEMLAFENRTLDSDYMQEINSGRGIASDIFTRFIKQQKKPTNLCVMKKIYLFSSFGKMS